MDRRILIWDILNAQTEGEISDFGKEIRAVAISPDGTLIAAASDEPKVRIWNSKTQQKIARLPLSGSSIRRLVFSPLRDTLAGAGDDGQVHLWTVDA